MDLLKILKKFFGIIALSFIVFISLIVAIDSAKTNKNQILCDSSNEKNLITSEDFALKSNLASASYIVKQDETHYSAVSRSSTRSREKEEYISIDEIEISKDMDLTQRCNISKKDFTKLMNTLKPDTSGFFAENAELIYDLCKEYSINEIFFCGLISAESGWNIAPNHRRTHNYISLMSSNGLIYFDSVENGLRKSALLLHEKYLTEGGAFYKGKTLEAVRHHFCPVNPEWTSLVYGRMKQILK